LGRDNVIPAADLSRMHAGIRAELDAAVARVLDRDWYILGPEVEAFEAEFAAYLGVQHVVGVGNGTDAITLTLRALDIGPGGEVIAPSFTAAPSIGAILAADATPVMVDVDATTRTLDPEAATAAVTPRTRALMPVHLYGQPADMAALRSLASKHSLALIEDAAQAHGAEYEGRKAGALGDVACFSFYPTKNLGALGDGGAIATNDATLAARLRRLRHLGQSARYVHDEAAGHSRLDELQAALLRVKLSHLDRWTAERRAIAARYAHLLKAAQGEHFRIPHEPDGTICCWHQYVVEVMDGDRDGFRSRLRDAGVGTDVHYPTPVHLQPGYAAVSAGPGSLPVTECLARTVVSLPMFVGLTEAEQERVSKVIERGPHPPAPSPNAGRGGDTGRRRSSEVPLSQDWERGRG
jgi:dTDP-4-amino-4,6-dideoxygalactose transaminase